MDRCFTLDELKKSFNPLSTLSLLIFITLSSICLVTASTIAGAELLRFSCNIPRGDKAPDWVKEEAYDDYGLKNGNQFPLYAFVLSEALPVLLVTLVYLVLFKVLQSSACHCGVFRAYLGVLLFRFLLLAVFVPLQLAHFYPVIFPSEWDFTPPPTEPVSDSGYNYTRALNTTAAPLVYHCKNHVALEKSILSIVLFSMQCIVLLLALIEIIYLWNKMGFCPDDKEFCRVYLMQVSGDDNNTASTPEQAPLVGQQESNEAPGRNEQSQSLEDQVTKLERILKNEYEERENTYVTPFPWLEDWQLVLHDIFIKVRMVERDTQRSGELKDKERDMYDIFESHECCENPRIVLVEGVPGIGKTVFCQKLATDWSKGQTGRSFPNFRIVLNLKCRDILSTSGDLDAKALEESIVDQLLPSDALEELKTALFQYMKTAECDVLLVLDGLDEFKRAVELDALKKELRPWQCKFLFTSRNDSRLRKSCDSLYQIVGFSYEDAEAYIAKFFGNDGNEMAMSLIDKIGSSAFLRDLVFNPLTTSLLCFVFNETGGELPSSKTKLYQELVDCVLRRKYKKDGKVPPPDPLAKHKEDLALLGLLALKGIKKEQLHFDEDEFNAEGRATTDVLHFGFLSRDKSASKRITSRSCYQFFHKTLQEYFAAFSLCVQLSDVADFLGSLRLLTEDELLRKYKQVLLFLVGMLSEKGEEETARRLFSSLAERRAEGNAAFGDFICDLLDESASVNAEFGEAMIEPVGSSWEVMDLFLPPASLKLVSETDVWFRLACAVVKADRPLRRLNLSRNNIRNLAALADALKTNSSLEDLLLCNSLLLTAESVGVLAAALTRHTKLEWLLLDKKFRDEPAVQNLIQRKPGLTISFHDSQGTSN